MLCRCTGVPRLFTLTSRPIGRRHASFTGRQFSPSYFTRTPITRFYLNKKALWLLPIAGGLTLYLLPQPRSLLSDLLSSPTVIPFPAKAPRREVHTVMSPSEPERRLIPRLLVFLKDTIWEPICTAARFAHLVLIFLPVIVTSPMLLVGTVKKKKGRETGDRWGALWWYDLLVKTMQAAGPTFVKLSQWAASRADLFPDAFCEKLGALHSRGKPHSFRHTKRMIEKAFQLPFDEVFEEFEHTPIGTGAIAQVYRATLKKDLLPPSYLGPRRQHSTTAAALSLQHPPPSVPTAAVAIKVLHPHAYKMIHRDLKIMNAFATALSILPGMEWLSLPEEVQVFGDMMFQQLDLRHEADNLLTFEENFSPRRVPLTFPRPLKSFSTTEILVEEYQNALPLEYFLRNGGGPYDDQIATIGLDAFLNMLLLDNFVHSDLHPGNIMVKFAKPPTTREVLSNLYRSFINSVAKFPDNQSQLSVADYSDSDRIVEELRPLAKKPKEWLERMESLSQAGYVADIVFIDAGLVTVLSESNRKNFLDLFHAMAQFDGYRAGELMIERCRAPHLAVDTETFALKMQHLVLQVKRKTFSLGEIKISDVLTEVLKAVREHHVKMEGDFVNTVISILLLEGIGRRLDPGLDLFKSSLPILRQLGRQMTAETTMGDSSSLSLSNLGAFLKVWVWLEARDLVAGSIANMDELIAHDWLTPSV